MSVNFDQQTLCKILSFYPIPWCGYCVFLQNFGIRNLGEITVFYTVKDLLLDLFLWSTNPFLSAYHQPNQYQLLMYRLLSGLFLLPINRFLLQIKSVMTVLKSGPIAYLLHPYTVFLV